jgi:Holliday junction DNA helicase RuvB
LGHDKITLGDTQTALKRLEIDELGLDRTDISMLESMMDKFGGGPVGLETLAATINEDSNTVEDVIEPFLLQLGFISRTPRGRVCTPAAYRHLNRPVPKSAQVSIFDEGK